jgi:hypothetical protein
MDNLTEAGQRIRTTQSLMRSQGMTDGENYRDLLTRLSTALATYEAGCEARHAAHKKEEVEQEINKGKRKGRGCL